MGIGWEPVIIGAVAAAVTALCAAGGCESGDSEGWTIEEWGRNGLVLSDFLGLMDGWLTREFSKALVTLVVSSRKRTPCAITTAQ
jgi:hypothetical protein